MYAVRAGAGGMATAGKAKRDCKGVSDFGATEGDALKASLAGLIRGFRCCEGESFGEAERARETGFGSTTGPRTRRAEDSKPRKSKSLVARSGSAANRAKSIEAFVSSWPPNMRLLRLPARKSSTRRCKQVCPQRCLSPARVVLVGFKPRMRSSPSCSYASNQWLTSFRSMPQASQVIVCRITALPPPEIYFPHSNAKLHAAEKET